MPVLVGGFAALVALAAGITANVDPVTTVIRSSLAFVLGWFVAKIWHAILNTQATRLERIGIEEANEPAESSE